MASQWRRAVVVDPVFKGNMFATTFRVSYPTERSVAHLVQTVGATLEVKLAASQLRYSCMLYGTRRRVSEEHAVSQPGLDATLF
jgi:hypothetical protein